MKIVEEDTKEGIIEVIPETLDDLWHLSHIVEVNDNVSSKTTRRIQDNTGDKLRSDRGIKKTFYLGIDVEGINFHLFTGKLRLTGVITRGPEDLIPLGSHHTLEVKLNMPLTIKKSKWPQWALKRLNQAIDASKKLYENIVNSINKFDSIQNIIIAGPGFYKNDFYDYLKDKYKDLASKSIIESTGTGGRVGIHEVLKKGTVEKLTVENRVAMEMMAVNDLLEKIAQNSSKIAYGLTETSEAITLGAVEKLLILDKMVATNNLGQQMDMVENMKGEVMVISCEHDGGKQLESLGGIAAILRYSIS